MRRSATPQSKMHEPGANRAIIFGIAALLAFAIGRVTNGSAQTGYDRPGGDYTSAPVANGDPDGVRGPLRAGQRLPRLELLLSCAFGRAGDVLAQARSGTGKEIKLLRIRRARRRRNRAAAGRDRIFDRSLWRRLSLVRNGARCQRQSLRRGLPKRAALSGLDLSPARLWRRLCALLSKGCDQAATASAVLYFRRGAVKPCYARRSASVSD